MIFGCVGQIGAQAWNIGRNAWLSAGLPEEVPAVTIDRQCGSSQQAVHFAAQGVMAGVYDLAIGGGVEVMSLVTLNSSGTVGPDLGMRYPFDGEGWLKRFGDQEIHQFRGGEMIAQKWDVTREEMEQLALASHQKAARAWDEGRFDNEVVPYGDCVRDEGVRPDTTLEKMATLKPLLGEGGRLTAATSSQIADGAAAVLVASEAAVERFGLTPRARIHTMSVVGSDPVLILTGPISATAKAIERSGLSIDDIDLFECNEAFASVVIAWSRETGRLARADQRQRRGHGPRPSAGRQRGQAHDDAAQRARAHRWPLRAADHVRGRRAVQRHDHRAGGLKPSKLRVLVALVVRNPHPQGDKTSRSRRSVARRSRKPRPEGDRTRAGAPSGLTGATESTRIQTNVWLSEGWR